MCVCVCACKRILHYSDCLGVAVLCSLAAHSFRLDFISFVVFLISMRLKIASIFFQRFVVDVVAGVGGVVVASPSIH